MVKSNRAYIWLVYMFQNQGINRQGTKQQEYRVIGETSPYFNHNRVRIVEIV